MFYGTVGDQIVFSANVSDIPENSTTFTTDAFTPEPNQVFVLTEICSNGASQETFYLNGVEVAYSNTGATTESSSQAFSSFSKS